MSTSATPVAHDERYASLQLLREAHAHLLAREQEERSHPDFLRDVHRFLLLGQATGALLDRRAERRATQSLLDYWVAGLYQAGATEPAVSLAPFDVLVAPELPDESAPYIGLDAFDEATEDRFFGRSEIIAEMLQQLQQSRMLAVVGTSGSGKSSIIRAGVLARLRHMAERDGVDWHVLPPFIPGSDPLDSLARTIYQATHGASGTAERRPNERTRRIIASLARELREGTTTLAQMIDAWISRPTVLTIDQFEELFTLCRDEYTREQFVANLLELVEHPKLTHRLILTMRSDFEDKVARLPTLKPRFDAARIQVTALSIAQLREAIETPASRVGLTFEDGIVDDLIGHALGETAALPLLQFTLSRLWELRTRNRVSMGAYQVLGGMSRALSTSADAWYQQLIPEEQLTARRIFLELVRPADMVVIATEAFYKGERRMIDRVLNEGLEVTRGRVRVSELYRTGEDPDRIMRVLGSMVARRLVRLSSGDTPADDQVEVAHEALIRNWETLQGWIEQDYERLRQRGRLIEAASQWEQSQQNPDLLWRGSQLEEAHRSGVRDLSVITFLTASQEAQDRLHQQQLTAREQINEAKRREAEEREQAAEARASAAETARRRAEDHARNARRLRILSVVLTLLTLVAVIATVFAFNAAIRAQSEADNAEDQRVTANAEAGKAAVARATAEASQALAETRRQTAEIAQVNAQMAATAVRESAFTAEADRETAVSAANKRATAEANAEVLVTTVSNERATAQILVTQVSNERETAQAAQTAVAALNVTLQAQNAQLSDRQNAQATIIAQQEEANNDLQVKNFVAAAENAVRNGGTDIQTIRTLIIDGLHVAALFPESDTIMDGLQATIQCAEGLPTINQLITSDAPLTSVAWSNDSSKIVITSDMSASIWSVDTRTKLKDLPGHGVAVWSRDGARIAAPGNGSTIIIWNTSDWNKILTFAGHKLGVQGLAWSPDAARIVSVDGSEIIVWDSTSGTVRGRYSVSGEQLTQAAWSPDGGNIVTAGNDGLRLRDGLTGKELLAGTDHRRLTSAAWSPDGQHILTISAEGDIQIWQANGLILVLTVANEGFKGDAAMWSRTGNYFVVAGNDDVVRTYERESGKLINLLRGHHGAVNAVAWSPDGLSTVSVDSDGTARIFYSYLDSVVERVRHIQRLLESH